MAPTDPRLLALCDEPVPRALRAAAAGTDCHLVGGVLRDRLLGIAGSDFDAVVAGAGKQICERLARELPARLVYLGGQAFAAYRLVGDGFTLDLWDRGDQELEADLARRDFTVNAFALDLADGALVDPFGGLADLGRRRLRATTARVFADDPLRVLRLVRLSCQLPGFAADPATVELARRSAAGLAGVAAERVREELAKVLGAAAFRPAFGLLVELRLYPGLLLGRPGRAGEAGPAARRLRRLEPALDHLADLPALPHGRLEPAAPRLALLFAALASDEAGAAAALERYRLAGYLSGRAAGLCRRLLACHAAPAAAPAARWFLHRWGVDWPAATAMLAAAAAPPLEPEGWRRLADRLAGLAAAEGAAIFAPPPLLDGREIGRLLRVPPGPAVGAAVARLRRAQVEGRVGDRAAAEALVRRLASGAG